ncbi:OmpA family protein [Clostridium sp. YIM B02506]|uniref:OmpA family protein n=1 Tax=Clostridium sp. YIM B02506 TaxID=2910680 RepID=UPI001EEDC051|nr:OmpA family protein [Clostridium sp. YIM B02506]
MAREKKPKKEVKTDAWLATYGDMVTLVLTFFVLMYSFSSVNEKKLASIASALNSLLTGNSSNTIMDGQGEMLEAPEVTAPSMYDQVKEFIEKNDLEDVAEIKNDARGVIIQLKDSILFDSGKADLIPQSKEVLDKISSLMATMDNNFIIEGHTDNIPINTYKFSDNWELSSDRATSVIRYFTQAKGLDSTKFQSAGYGEFRPLVDNSTEENRAKNRRVNILIVATEKESN